MSEPVHFEGPEAWRGWLAANHKTADHIWLLIAKKNAGVTSVTYAQALDEALCYGWIDGLKRSFDAQFFQQRFSKRGKTSIWSQVNRDKALGLIARGLMQEQGLAEVEKAKTNGRWDAAYAGSKSISVPPDLAKALAASPKANSFFKTLSAQNRFAILFRIGNVKRAETRTKNIAKFVGMLELGQTIYP
ncbi:MAG: YdeI/OmpD-associated family protein [Alphaproteobacteria bacterium]|nr:YdeI/OmpD-associated family protein [Alphaproteobacteria bacterium]